MRERRGTTIFLLEGLKESFGVVVLGQALNSRQRLATVALCKKLVEAQRERKRSRKQDTYAGYGCERNSWVAYHQRRRRKGLNVNKSLS